MILIQRFHSRSIVLHEYGLTSRQFLAIIGALYTQ